MAVTQRAFKCTHHNWLIERGYTFHVSKYPSITHCEVYYQKLFNDLHINVQVYDFTELMNIEHFRYEIAAQLNGKLTMNVLVFTLFDGNLTDKLASVETYIQQLNLQFAQVVF